MAETIPSLTQLRALIGMCVSFCGRDYTVIEILEHPLAVVGQAINANTPIQPDLHGNAHRRGKEIVLIQVTGNDGTSVHEDFLQLQLE
jgi:hypothetical protein